MAGSTPDPGWAGRCWQTARDPLPNGWRDSVSERVRIHTITVACTDARAAARFWRDFLGYEVRANHTSSIHLEDPDGVGPDLLFAWTEDAKVAQNRLHFDLRPPNQDAALEHALMLGATVADIGQSGHESWVVLHDPAGNEFCILQSTDDLAAWAATAALPTSPDLDS